MISSLIFFILGETISVTIENDGITILMNGVSLKTDRYDGRYFVERKLKLEAANSESRWNMDISYSDGTVKSKEFESSDIRLTIGDFNVSSTVRIVSVHFYLVTPTGMKNSVNMKESEAYFLGIDGRRTTNPQKGVNIIVHKDNKVNKIIIK